MTTYAHVVNGFAVDVMVTPPTLASRFNADWLAANPFTQVPDNDVNGHPLQHGATTTDGGVSFTNPAISPPPAPQPINPGNPYFGKEKLETKDFYALTGQVLGARYPRLRTDPAFLWISDVLSKIEIVDVDDKKGQFLQIITYLEKTNATDDQPLMSAQDVAAVMAAWPSVQQAP